MMKKNVITEQAVVSHFFCRRKAYQILFNNNIGEQKIYLSHIEKRRRCNENDFFSVRKNVLSFSDDKFSGKSEIIKNANIQLGNLKIQELHLQKRNAESKFCGYHYEPIIFSISNTIKKEDRIKISYICSVLSDFQGNDIYKATIILIDGKILSVRLGKKIHIPILNELQKWVITRPEIPPVTNNKHCPYCKFENACKFVAEKEDNIVLLGNMTQKVQKKFNSKGIFTINQLSYLYKPKRRRRINKDRTPKHQFELQALALRTQKIYTTELIKPPEADVEIYIDIESIPELRFHYLIGMLVCDSEQQIFNSFWANNQTEEKYIWECFLKTVNNHSNSPIFHYGSYEKKVIKELGSRYNYVVESICDRLCNINSYIYGRIYFPTHTNRLKDICKYLGLNWSAGISGLDSIVLRNNYDQTGNPTHRDCIETYNKEDCINLKKLKDVVSDISKESFRQDLIAVNDINQPLNEESKKVAKDFNEIIRSAHSKYVSVLLTPSSQADRSVA